MKIINLLLIFTTLFFLSCAQEGEETGGGLYIGHQLADNEYSLTVPSDGVYGVGQNLDFVLTHPGSLVVNGAPYLTITVGGDTYNASYIAGSGSNSLTFRYTIQTADQDIDGIDLSSAINLNGGSLSYSSSGVLSAAPTTFSVPDSEIRVDTSTPTIIGNSTPIPKTYVAGETLFFVLTYDTQVLVTGTPRLPIDVGGVTRYANYLGGSGTSTIFFTYLVQAADADPNGITQTTSLQLNGGTIRDVANNVASLTFAAGDTSSVLVNGSAPYVTSVTKPGSGTYFSGNIITFDLVFSEVVTVASGTPSVNLFIGPQTRAANYVSGSGTNTLRFQYVVANPDLDNNGIIIDSLVNLNGATIRDAGNDNAVQMIPTPLTPSVLVYGILPTITSVTAPANNDYVEGSVLDFQVQFSEDVVVTNTPRLALTIGANTRYATYISGTGTDVLTFRYTVLASGSDNDNDGIAFASSSIELNGGTIVSEFSSTTASQNFSGLEPVMTGVTVNQAPATQLVITQQPTDTYSTTNIAPAITVELRDGSNNLVTSSTDNVTISIGTNPSSGTLSGTLTVAAVGGIATFSDLQINNVGSGYTLSVVSGGLTGDTSNTFDIIPATATKLGFFVEPSNTVAGVSISPSIQVRILDAGDNVVTSATNNVTLVMGNNPNSGTLSGTVTVAAVSGVATFSDISIDKVATGYTLVANTGGLTSATSTAFNITPNTATQLAFGTQPSSAEANAAINPAFTVEIQDAYGNRTADTNTIALVINSNPGSGTLSGTTSVAAIAGVATFSDISINNVGVGYTLDATSGGLTLNTSAAFDITNTPTQLVITTQPTNAQTDAAISPAITVEIRDASNALVTSATDNVTIAINANPGSGTLAGTLTVAAVAGVATFSDISINNVGTAYTLDVTATGLTLATSSTFNITPAPATKLAFGTQPSNTLAGQAMTSFTVEIQDAASNVVTTATDNVTIAFGTDPSSSTATLGGTLTVAAVAGVATFTGINIDKAFTGYTFGASSGALTAATSSAFDISPYTAVKLGYTVQPVDTTDSAAINPAIEVSILDTFDNVVTSASATITLAFGANPGSATLGGTLSQATTSGVATFNDITVNSAATGYTLQATGGGYTAATSSAFTIFGTPSKLGFQIQPVDTALGNNIPSIVVNILDSADNIIGSATNTVTIALSTDPSSGSATLGGTLSLAAVSGQATFTGVSLNQAYANYGIIATSGALTSVTSNLFDITIAPPTSLTLITPASSPDSDSTPTIRVAGVVSTDVVKVFTDGACSSANLVAAYTASGTTVDVTTSSLVDGSYTFYATRTTSGGTPSACSSANLAYTVSGSYYDLSEILNAAFQSWSDGGGDRSWDSSTGQTVVGPSSPQAGTHFAFTDAASNTGGGVNPSDEFILELTTALDGSASGSDLSINFKWNKRGDNMGNLYFEASNDGGTTWATLWSHLGADVATNGTDVWRNQFVDVCDAGYTSTNVKMRFRGVMPASGTIDDSMIGIDELEISSGGCLPAPPATVAILTPTSTDIVGVTNMNSFTVSGTCSDNGQNITLSGDVAGVTSCATGTWSINLDLSAHADGNIIINADHSSAGGGPNGADTVTVVKDSVTIQFDDFQTLGNWTQDTGDNQDFTLTSGDTPTVNVGPSSGEGGSGNYLYTESSAPTTNSDEFIIYSNSLDADTYDMDFKFYWNKRGNSMGDIFVEVSPDDGATWDTASFTHTGADVAKGGVDVWNLETLDLCTLGYNSGTLKVRIKVVMPAAGQTKDSDIGIDSVRVTNEGCQ